MIDFILLGYRDRPNLAGVRDHTLMKPNVTSDRFEVRLCVCFLLFDSKLFKDRQLKAISEMACFEAQTAILGLRDGC